MIYRYKLDSLAIFYEQTMGYDCPSLCPLWSVQCPQTGWARQKSGGGGHRKFFSGAWRRNLCPSTFNLLPAPLAGLTIKFLLSRQKNTFSYIVMQVIWCLKFCNMTKSGGEDNRPSKFWGTCPPVLLPRDLRPWGLGYWAVCLFNTPILSVVCV